MRRWRQHHGALHHGRGVQATKLQKRSSRRRESCAMAHGIMVEECERDKRRHARQFGVQPGGAPEPSSAHQARASSGGSVGLRHCAAANTAGATEQSGACGGTTG